MADFSIVNRITLVCSKRNSGKSTLIRSLIEDEKHKFKKILVVCPTEKINNFYSKNNLVQSEYIYDEYSENLEIN